MAIRRFPLLPPILALSVTLIVACSPSTDSSSDASSADAGSPDSSMDAGSMDAGSTDAGSMDADAGETDGGDMEDGGTTDDGGMNPPPDVEILGAWDDNYGDKDITVNDSLWGEDTVVSYDNAHHSAVTQTYSASQYNPDKFNKVVWTAPAGGSFWFCMVDYGLDTADAALNSTNTADATDPSAGGCGGAFPWTQMTPHAPDVEVAGLWADQFGDPAFAISDVLWGEDPIVNYDNGTRIAITKTAADSPYNPNTYNRIVWTAPSGGTFYFCETDYALATAEAAAAATTAADSSQPDTGGCGGFPWSKMTPAE